MIRVSIIGTGQIGFDLLYKLLKLNYVQIIAFVGRRHATKTIPHGILYSDQSIQFFILNPNCCDVVFDCTDAFSAKINNDVFSQQNIHVIDLTPSNIGCFYIPRLTLLTNNSNSNIPLNINMVTCGGQVSIPLLNYLHNKIKNVTYAEIITQISSDSAGMATRINIDKYIETTESAIHKIVGINNCKVILNVNPCKTTTMKTTIYLKVSSRNDNNYYVFDDYNIYIKQIQEYIPLYHANKPIWISDNILMVHITVLGIQDYISIYSGNLDIINCAAMYALKDIYTQQLSLI